MPAARQGEPAAAQARRYTVSLRWENDVVAGMDRNYSNGMSLTLAREGRGPLGGVWSWFGLADGRFVSSYEVGQLIVTPGDISRPVPDPTDRPYAGLLYGAASTQIASGNRFHGLKLIAGVVGPASHAEQAQKAFHKLIGNPKPQGWAYQLKNEAVLNLVYEHRRRYAVFGSTRGWSAQLIPVVGGMLGNVLIQAQADAQFRIGYVLPDDFGTTQMRGLGNMAFPASGSFHEEGRQAAPPRRFGVYAFAGGGASLVARNLTLDGNTFGDSPHVDKTPLFPGAEVGVSMHTPSWKLTFGYVFWGREFETQAEPSHFGTATLAFHF